MAQNKIVTKVSDLNLSAKAFSEILNSQDNNEGIVIGICELGFCVRAKRKFIMGELIYTFKGPTIPFQETITRGDKECMSIQFDRDKYIDTEAPGCYVNHSCEPNAGLINNFDMVALEDIQVNDEIRFDYSTTMDEDHYVMECKCGRATCRKIVTDFKNIPIQTQQKYLNLGIVMDFIRRQI